MNTAPKIFFGKAVDFPVSFKDAPAFITLLEQLAEKLDIPELVINYQVHGVDGRVATKRPQTEQFMVDYKTHDGDYLITRDKGLAIGVHTADCLPLVFYAPDKHVIAAAHAGWKGTVAGIGRIVVERLIGDFGIDVKKLKVWFGPAGGNCCYEVKDDFVTTLENQNPLLLPVHRSHLGVGGSLSKDAGPTGLERAEIKNASPLITRRDGKMFFDNGELNRQQLIAAGVDESNIDRSENRCTICNHEYHSYRRAIDKSQYFTQATIVWME